MGKEIITLGDIKLKKHKFHQHKRPISINDIEIGKTVESNKVPFGRKVLNILSGTKIVEPFRPLCAMLPKMNAYRKLYDTIWYYMNKVSKVIKKGFDGELLYNDNYIKAKLKSYEVRINTNFLDDKYFT